jgi:cobalt-zinc-cadmium efflux system protein
MIVHPHPPRTAGPGRSHSSAQAQEPAPHTHSHSTPASAQAQHALAWALAITATFAIIEAVGGWLAGSLALISDAGHMVTDAASLALALFAQWIARRPPSRRASYGYARAEVLAAFINALALLALVVFIAIEAVSRLLAPRPVAGGLLLGIAIAGMLANLFSAWMLAQAGASINARGALLHVISDLLGSVAAIIAGAVILFTGWTPIDPILSLVVSLLILRSTWRLLAQSTGVLMEGVPQHLDYEAIGRALLEIPGVAAAHDLHVWNMGADRVALSAHLLIRNPPEWPQILSATQRMLATRFGIDHVTLQPDWRPAGDKRVIPVTPIAGDEKPHLH